LTDAVEKVLDRKIMPLIGDLFRGLGLTGPPLAFESDGPSGFRWAPENTWTEPDLTLRRYR
jgi:hypothetical protein